MRSEKKQEESISLFPSVLAHRFHFHSIFWCLLGSQVETQHLIGQFSNHSRAAGERLQVKQYPFLNLKEKEKSLKSIHFENER